MSQSDIGFLRTLESVIQERLEAADSSNNSSSYTAGLAAAGSKRIAQKVGEEAVELALAAVAGDRQEILNEAADLTYHLLVLLNTQGLCLAEVVSTLEGRHDRA